MTASTVVAVPIAYRPAAAAKAIGCSRSRLYELIAAGEIEARKDGANTVILHDELVAYVQRLPVSEAS